MSIEDFVNIEMEDASIKDTLTMNIVTKHSDIGIDAKVSTTQMCVTIEACEINEDNDDRAPVDIVIALDISGSMTGSKLELCKTTLELLLRCLNKKDRFGLITYATCASVAFPAKLMTKANKEKALDIIKKLRTRDCTNISDAIGLACQEFRNILKPNEVQTLFLLTDGLANKGISDSYGLCELTKNCLKCCNSGNRAPVTLHTFGYGTDHNSALLGDLAAVTQGGSYYFVENDSSVGTAFGDALGGVLSVVAQSVVVTIKPSQENRIRKVFHEEAIQRDNGVFTVAIGDFYAEEKRDIIFEVDLIKPETPSLRKIPHASASLTYTDTIKKILISTKPMECSISRSHGLGMSAVNQHVTKQWLRVITVEELKTAEAMGRNRQLSQARERLQNHQARLQNEIQNGGVEMNDVMMVEMVGDVQDCINNAGNEQAFNRFGAKKIRSHCYTHTYQRRADAREVDNEEARKSSYMTKRKMRTKQICSTSSPKTF